MRKPPKCWKTSARAAATPPDFWFRLGEIYERRLNDPVEGARGVRESPAGIAALQRRAAEAESEIGSQVDQGSGDQGLLISIVPVTTSIEITGSPLPSVVSPHRGPHVSRVVNGMSDLIVTVQRQRQDARIDRALGERQPHVTVERAQPQQPFARQAARRSASTEPMPASSRSVPDKSLPSIGPRRMSAVMRPLNPSIAMRPSSTCTRSIAAERGRRTVTSARSAGSVVLSVCSARTMHARGGVVDGQRHARQLRGGRRVTFDDDFGVGLVPAFDPHGADGDFNRQRLAGRQWDGLRLAIGDVRRRDQQAGREDDPHARIILSAYVSVLRCSAARRCL